MMEDIFQQAEKKMTDTVEALRREYAGVRTGRASISLLEGITVEYYGSQMHLNQVATLSVPDPRTITIQPWDTSLIGEIERAIQRSELGLNPSNDGRVIRVPIPALSEERRRELVKLIKRMAEDCRISIRNHRREAIEQLKRLEKEKKISEDDCRRGQDKVQKLTDEYVQKINQIQEHKEKEIMEV